MIVTGGCCHDYTGQSKVLMDTLNAVMPINWTVVQGMTRLPDGKLPLYENPDWARGMDIVVHNECWANGDLPAPIVQNITRPNVARMFFHCSLHSYRVMTDDSWRELIGMTSRRHTRAHNILLKWADGDPITAGLPPYVTPIDELYVIEKVWPNTKALATAVSPEPDGATYPLVWTHEYHGARVFGTSLGHGNETFNTNQFKELVTRGFRWALKKEPIALPQPEAPTWQGSRHREGRSTQLPRHRRQPDVAAADDGRIVLRSSDADRLVSVNVLWSCRGTLCRGAATGPGASGRPRRWGGARAWRGGHRRSRPPCPRSRGLLLSIRRRTIGAGRCGRATASTATARRREVRRPGRTSSARRS